MPTSCRRTGNRSSRDSRSPEAGASGPGDGEGEPLAGPTTTNAGADPGDGARHGASREESLTSTDFSELNRGDHIRDIETLMRRFARRMKHLRLRREAISPRGRRLDLRGTIRRSVSTGGTPMRLSWRERRRVRPRLVLLLDVSRSMSLYSFFFMRLARALCAELADVHCFIFHTRITPIGEALRDQDPRRSQERLHLLAEGWAGGTRIGECLADFNRGHASRLVHSRTGVIVVSDGYDTGDPEVLAQGARRDLAGARAASSGSIRCWGRRASVRNRGACRPRLPHLDLLAPGHDLASIERALPKVIEALR